MGCLLCKEQEEISDSDKQSIPISEHGMSGEQNGIQIEIIKGDILTQQAQCMIIGSDIYMKNRTSFQKSRKQKNQINQKINQFYQNQKTNSQIQYGQAFNVPINVVQNPQSCQCLRKKARVCYTKQIIQVILPLWKGGQNKEIQILKQGLQYIFSQVLNIESVAFTDLAISKFGYRLQDVAKLFSQSLREFLDSKQIVNRNENDQIQLRKILVVLRDDKEIQYFQSSLIKQNLIKENYSRLEFKKIKKFEAQSDISSRYTSIYQDDDINNISTQNQSNQYRYTGSKSDILGNDNNNEQSLLKNNKNYNIESE